MADQADIGVFGLAVMGANLARNAARRGFGVAVFNRNHERTDELVAEHGGEGRFFPASALPDFIASIAKPRPILIMVKAGPPVDEVIDELMPHLEAGDIIIDGGNSLFTDTARRHQTCEAKKIRFVGTGVSGGEEGALEGPSMMPGGDREAWDRIAPMLTKMAAQVDGVPCCTYIGPQGAGHYVKMVHNGIEYADMQLIAEAYDLMKSVYGLGAPEMADIFQTWKQGDLDSYLIEITAAVLRKTDNNGKPLVDVILDQAEQKGTGRWTAQNALELGVPLTAITEAVYARVLSANRAMRLTMENKTPRSAAPGAEARPSRNRRHPGRALRLQDHRLRSRFRADVGRLGAIQMGSQARRHGDHLARRVHHSRQISGSHQGGLRTECEARQSPAGRLPPERGDENRERLAAGDRARGRERRARAGLYSSLAYYDGLRRARGPANLLQGLRDYFGAHTYHRLDKEGSFHTRWSQDGSEVKM